jgi:hypothetical protein
MASSKSTPGGPSSNPPSISGIVDLEVDVLDIELDYALNAVKITVLNPAGDGILCWLDMPLALDAALRLVAAHMRLRGMVP